MWEIRVCGHLIECNCTLNEVLIAMMCMARGVTASIAIQTAIVGVAVLHGI